MKYTIRPIRPQDNPQMRAVILQVSEEYGTYDPTSQSGAGAGAGDAELQDLCAAYSGDGSRYWVIEHEQGEVVGGGGYARLKGSDPADAMCEMQKLFVLPEARGKGFGKQLVQLCLREAAHDGYREMYLETVAQMRAAIRLYEGAGFTPLPHALGKTGHCQCTVYMIRKLEK